MSTNPLLNSMVYNFYGSLIKLRYDPDDIDEDLADGDHTNVKGDLYLTRIEADDVLYVDLRGGPPTKQHRIYHVLPPVGGSDHIRLWAKDEEVKLYKK